MAMTAKGLAKLIEECGELQQIAAKKLAYLDTDSHPDGTGSMKFRLENEMSDVLAAMHFVADKFALDVDRMDDRAIDKYKLYHQWDSEN